MSLMNTDTKKTKELVISKSLFLNEPLDLSLTFVPMKNRAQHHV